MMTSFMFVQSQSHELVPKVELLCLHNYLLRSPCPCNRRNQGLTSSSSFLVLLLSEYIYKVQSK